LRMETSRATGAPASSIAETRARERYQTCVAAAQVAETTKLNSNLRPDLPIGTLIGDRGAPLETSTEKCRRYIEMSASSPFRNVLF